MVNSTLATQIQIHMKLLKDILVAGVCSVAATAFAWHEPGHMITALIAYEKLSPEAQLLEILKEHPRFDADFKSQMPEGLSDDDQGKWLFCRASIWPDLVRRKSDGNLIPNPKVKTSYHCSHWHFINFGFVLLPSGTSKQLEDRASRNLQPRVGGSRGPSH